MEKQSKEVLPIASTQPVLDKQVKGRHARLLTVALCVVAILTWLTCGIPGRNLWSHSGKHHKHHGHPHRPHDTCKQVPALYPRETTTELANMDMYMETVAFRNASIERLSGAVQVDTQSFDDLGAIGEDKRWDTMYNFADYLKKTFPYIHVTLELEKVNTHGLLYTWKGTDESLKPTLLMAHQDVVPVPDATVGQWTHPPFSGFYDGKYIWGRGSSDCKNNLIGIMESVEELIKARWRPRRTILLSFGFDEEISGMQGAGHLAPVILERYGKDGVAAIVDEGAGFSDAWGMRVAMPGVGEKGYTDVHITVRMPGGHSSIPPDHTGIGVMSELVSLIEAHPYTPHLDDANPYLKMLTCGAEHAPSFPSKLRKLLHRRASDTKSNGCKHNRKDALAEEAAKQSPATRYLMQTSVATDMINGGVKVNALPERTTAIVNHRINIGSSPAEVHAKITSLAKSIAHKYNLTLHAFDDEAETPSSITLSASKEVLEVAPVTPSDPNILSPWSILAGTTKALYGEDLIVAPSIMTGNTDTRRYWDLTKHIYRYAPGWDGEQVGLGKVHTVDEHIPVLSHINTARWMSVFVRNMDQSELD